MQVPIAEAILALQEARQQGSLADVAAPPLGWQLVPGSSVMSTRLFSSDGRLGLPGTLHRYRGHAA